MNNLSVFIGFAIHLLYIMQYLKRQRSFSTCLTPHLRNELRVLNET